MSVVRRHHLPPAPTGLVLALVSAASFGMSGTLATSLLRAGWTPLAAVTVRIGVAALALTPPALLVLRRATPPGAPVGAWRSWLGWRGGAGAVALYGLLAVAGCQLCYFEAIRHLSVAVALLLEYSGTVLVVGWMWLVHRRRPGPATVAGGLVAVVGLGLVLGVVGGTVHVDAVGVLWGAGAAIGNGAYFVMAAGAAGPPRPGTVEVPPLVVAWGGMVAGTAVMALVALTGVLPWSSPAATVVLGGWRTGWLVPVLGLALVAAAFAYAAGVASARLLGARVASFVGLSEVLFASLYAYLLVGEGLGRIQLLGGALVLAGIVLVRRDPEPAGGGGAAGGSTIEPRPASTGVGRLATVGAGSDRVGAHADW
ncbi:MAG TPA: EamA family transporter [Acidimicrobiales bacterium]|nr:EamA family transporter [Acidimicrobiales bacterium]